jgi:hypothetical protein
MSKPKTYTAKELNPAYEGLSWALSSYKSAVGAELPAALGIVRTQAAALLDVLKRPARKPVSVSMIDLAVSLVEQAVEASEAFQPGDVVASQVLHLERRKRATERAALRA